MHIFLQGALNYYRSCYLPPCPRHGWEEEEEGENKLHILFNIFLVFFRSWILFRFEDWGDDLLLYRPLPSPYPQEMVSSKICSNLQCAYKCTIILGANIHFPEIPLIITWLPFSPVRVPAHGGNSGVGCNFFLGKKKNHILFQCFSCSLKEHKIKPATQYSCPWWTMHSWKKGGCTKVIKGEELTFPPSFFLRP